LGNLAETANVSRNFRLIKDIAEIQTACFPMIDRFPDFEAIDTTNHPVHLAEAKLCHDLAHFFGDETHEVDDMLRLAREALAQFRVLCRHANRAGVQMANTHENAAHGDQRRRGETEFFSAEQSGDNDIATRFELPVSLDNDSGAQIIEDES